MDTDVQVLDAFLARLADILAERYDRNTTLGQVLLSTHIMEAMGRGEQVTTSDLAKRLDLPLSSVSRWLQGGQEQGLLEYMQSEHDDRKRYVSIKPEYHRYIRRHHTQMADLLRRSHEFLSHHGASIAAAACVATAAPDGAIGAALSTALCVVSC